MEKVVEFLRGSPEVAKTVPGLAKVLVEFKPMVGENRVTLNVDAQQAAAIVAAVMAPAGEAAGRNQCTNNEKQIVLALHNYHQKHGSFPPAYSTGKDGKPLLSWRVLILPFLDQQALYDQFHLDEAWDSPHNRTLISKMPATYRCPAEVAALAVLGKTRYLAPRGDSGIMHDGKGVSLRDITDGTSSTIITIDAGDEHAVEWTRPEDWQFDPEPGIESIFRSHAPGGINAAFADGAVRFIRATIAPVVLRAMLSRNGGEAIHAEDL
jgi:prepilin-type processing-associated H-X9-DG protein